MKLINTCIIILPDVIENMEVLKYIHTLINLISNEQLFRRTTFEWMCLALRLCTWEWFYDIRINKYFLWQIEKQHFLLLKPKSNILNISPNINNNQ